MDLKRLSEQERVQAESQMRDSLFEESQVGIFWYTPELGVFGDESYPASLIKKQGNKTYPKVHDRVWIKKHKYARAKNDQSSPFFSTKDPYKYPRGRVFINGDKLEVMVGKWIDDYPQAKDEIIDVFNLPQDVEFKYDSHWDIGHSWSEDTNVNYSSYDDFLKQLKITSTTLKVVLL